MGGKSDNSRESSLSWMSRFGGAARPKEPKPRHLKVVKSRQSRKKSLHSSERYRLPAAQSWKLLHPMGLCHVNESIGRVMLCSTPRPGRYAARYEVMAPQAIPVSQENPHGATNSEPHQHGLAGSSLVLE